MTASKVQALGRVLFLASANTSTLALSPAADRSCIFAAGAWHQCKTSRFFTSSSSTSDSQDDGAQASSSAGNSLGSSSSSDARGAAGSSQDGYRVLYEGFFARPHKRLKYASLLNTFASFAAAPLIISYSSASPIARVAVTVSVLAFAVITTGGLHWFTKPYIHQLQYNDKTDTAKVQTLSFFGGSRWTEFPLHAVQAPTGYHPLASFKVHGKTYYIDRANFSDAALLGRLLAVSDSSNAHVPEQQPLQDQKHQQQES